MHDVLGLSLFPEGEIDGVAFLLLSVEVVARGVDDVLEVAAREAAVVVYVVVLRHVEIDAALALVGEAVGHDLLHQFNLLDDVSRGVGLDAGRQHVQRLHGAVVAVLVILHHLHRLQLLQTGLLGYLVLAFVGVVFQMAHVGDVAHIAHLVAQMLEVAEQHIERDGRTGVAQMSVAIHRRAAYIHAHMTFVEGAEEFLRTRQRVINKQLVIHNT